MMRKIPDFLAGTVSKVKLGFQRLGLVPGIVCLCSFTAAVLFIVTQMELGVKGLGDLGDFEVGKVADRDVIAEYPLSYIDQEATNLRMEAQQNLLPAVFRYSSSVSDEVLKSWAGFCRFTDELAAKERPQAPARWTEVQIEYPAYFTDEALTAYFASPRRADMQRYGYDLLNEFLHKGIFSLDTVDMGVHNPDIVELIVSHGDRTERKRINYGTIITLDNVERALAQAVENADMPPPFETMVPTLLRPFIRENVFFSHEDTRLRVTEAMERVAAVVKTIEKDKRIIRKGFVITKEEMMDLQALSNAIPKKDPRSAIGMILLLALLYVLFILLQSRLVMSRDLSAGERCLLFVLVCLYLAGAGLTRNLVPSLSAFPVSLFFPTALIVMIPSVFLGPRLSLVMAMALPLGAGFAEFFDTPSFIFALISGIVASAVLRHAEKRMDLIKAGLAIAVANCVAIIVIMLVYATDVKEYPSMLFWAALNGIVSGMLILGVLPPLEHILNAATTFRLIELSDLNAPVLRKLFTIAPGTYSHSIMVANLAEQACQDIGANALLARVGAYYHDIGKMDNPDYFVENQTDYNRHDAIAPRLSATVIRSHVKLGVEKARGLGLPPAVIDIIAEHHGNSLIVWFYKKATEQEEQVSSEDFSYPGVPPRARESAVVMLADVTEAAVRTLIKPTATKLEKFIQQLIDGKIEQGQLSQSDLTFRELEIIKNGFVRVLAGYYHSRIEYPKNDTDTAALPVPAQLAEDEA